MSSEYALVVESLRVEVAGTTVDIVDEIRFSLARGEALGIVGESGCGKTTVAMALLGWARPGTHVAGGSVLAGGADVLSMDEAGLRSVRGRVISYVPQNPARALSPGMRVGAQLQEMLEVHVLDERARRRLLDEAWAGAQLPEDPAFRRRYPHQLSGGQQQRVAIAMALVCEPAVIVMDEPTTGLDVLTQERLLEVIGALRRSRRSSIVYISHDLGVVRNLVDHVAVMYGGRIVEHGRIDDVFRSPQHPYTRNLLEAIPRLAADSGIRGIPGSAVEPWNRPPGCPFAPRCEYRIARCDQEMPGRTGGDHMVRCWRAGDLGEAHGTDRARGLASVALLREEPLLSVRDLTAGYRVGSSLFRGRARERAVVDDVSFDLEPGSCLAVVGESGSGKTTLARCVAGLHGAFVGAMTFDGRPLTASARDRDLELRRQIQIVFQDPDSSLNPSMSTGTIVGRPLQQFYGLRGTHLRQRVGDLLEQVHLPASMATRLPRELSGGEKQRVAIARALAGQPRLLICDEITSALDVAVQASILELLAELRETTAMTMIFVSHDLAVVRTISDRVLVMSSGRIEELASTPVLFDAPAAEYTRRLLAAAPDLRAGDYPQASASAAAAHKAARDR